ncbi:uncharacterized protein [Physcomitrium patens]|uniref:Uncharacterized protein n=1 Tax=Physcomitrium patens TaxID=3218 RepID=A0A2K1KCT8_PHYPA|nr:uncharacterized protein LOC112285213 [Physcomitrium patens]XP_024381646.1 uncharacterized protein LOC112285213 [Physcomitrium patens]XP_024381647.1 uncharacterized protein LOC112285213 [Physcomitrium patens]PNR51588.1 hypothetical protein PHYPA_010775 [Physcomitrium patens]|eukprot:XP_024381645.1 uncharacterized protein LOC112285213 [Physcomitrella patens]
MTILVNRCEMAPPVKVEVPISVSLLNSSNDADFYVATFKEGEICKVLNTRRGSSLKFKRVLDFNDTVKLEQRTTPSHTRDHLRSGSGNDVQEGKREKTLAEFVLELKRRKNRGSLATVKWNPPVMELIPPVDTVTSLAEEVDAPVSAVIPPSGGEVPPVDMVASPVDVVIAPSKEVVAPVDEAISAAEIPVTPLKARSSKDRKRRRSSNELQLCSKLLDTPSKNLNSQYDNETRPGSLKKSASTVGRASSDNTGIKVFQRRKVKFKAIRARVTEARAGGANAGSNSGVQESSTVIQICDDLCQCENCESYDSVVRESFALQPTVDILAARSSMDMARSDGHAMQSSAIEISQSSSVVRMYHPENTSPTESNDVTLEKLSHLDPSVQGLPTPSTSCNSSQVCILDPSTREIAIQGINDVIDAASKHLGGEIAQELPSDIEGEETLDSCLSCNSEHSLAGRDDQSVLAPDVGLVLRAPNVLMEDAVIAPVDNSLVAPRKENSSLESSEISADIRIASCHSEPPTGNSQFAAVNFASTVTPTELEMTEGRIDALLDSLATPDDLLPNHLSGTALGVSKTSKKKKRKRRSFTEDMALDMLVGMDDTMYVLNVPDFSPKHQEVLNAPFPLSVPQSGLDFVPSSTKDLVGKYLLSRITTRSETCVSDTFNEVNLTPQPHGLAPEAKLGSHSGDEDALRVQENILPTAEENRSSESNSPKADSLADVSESPTKSSCPKEVSGVVLEGDANDASDTVSTPKGVLFSNLKTDSLSKRNRKTFSPNSRLKLIEASRPDSARKSSIQLKIKKMKSNLSEACPSKTVCRKIDLSENCTPQVLSPSNDDIPASNEVQEVMRCGVEHIEQDTISVQHTSSLPPVTTEVDSSTLSPASTEPSSGTVTRIVAGSPEHKKPSARRHSPNADCTGSESISNLPLPQGSLPVGVGSQTELPVGPCTLIEKSKTSQRPRSILKTGEESRTCRGICKCPRCISTRDQSVAAREFITSQMKLAENITTRLIQEMRSMRSVVEGNLNSPSEPGTSTAYDTVSDKSKGALDRAVKMEDWAIAQILKLSRDSKRVCRLIETGPRRTIFADAAGSDLEHVRLFPSKKTPPGKKIASVL